VTHLRLTELDPHAPIHYQYAIDQVLYRGKSPYQEFAVVTNPFFGRMLILDGVVQFTEKDEFFYHEMMAHVALHAIESPKRVIVVGGGDGGVVREVLKHPTIEQVHLVDIDPEVTRISREFFPTVSSGLDDPRVIHAPMDGAMFMRQYEGQADAIIVDSTDIIGFATSLFTSDFFDNAKAILGKNGVYITLSESLHFHFEMVRDVQKTMASIFPHVDLYTAPIATYGGNWWCFAVGTNGVDIRKPVGKTVENTRYYCEEVHKTAFLPDFLYKRLMDEERTYF